MRTVHKKNTKTSLGSILLNITTLISILVAIWFIVSFIDVNLHNDLTESKEKAPWNMFVMMVEK